MIRAHREHDVPGRRDRRQQPELLVGGPFGAVQVSGLLGDPARAVVIGHVAGEQAVAVGRDPLEFAGELHPLVAADGAVRSPLVERAARPGRRGEPGGGHQPGVAGVVPEGIQHPRRLRIGAEHVALVADAVDRVPDRGLGAGQVRVRLVVAAAGDLDPARRDEPAQVGAVFGMRVEVRLQVVDLGQHELVVRVLARGLQVQGDELERGPDVGQAAIGLRQQQAALGELALGAPPDRVVVEVGHHPHRPARLGRGDLAPAPAPGRPARPGGPDTVSAMTLTWRTLPG